MIVEPKIRGFICLTAHPKGCYKNVQDQIAYAEGLSDYEGPKKVLVIGASTGYGLSSRIAALATGAATIGVSFERPASGKRTASAGWYNTACFEEEAARRGVYAKSINGDAFSDEIKAQTLEMIKQDWDGQVDLVVYSLASPRRIHPRTGETYNSCLKPIGKTYSNKSLDVMSGMLENVSIEPATEDDIHATEMVMGGEDWEYWMDALKEAGLLADNCITLAYSYIGPEITYPVYHNGTIGRAKAHLAKTAESITSKGTRAMISVNKALVTQASSAIPVVPLYISALLKVMKEKGLHEGCIEQMVRMFKDRLYTGEPIPVDQEGRIRLDDWEMRDDVQSAVAALWDKVNPDNLLDLIDLEGYRTDFKRLFGFDIDGIDYSHEVDVDIPIPSICTTV